MNNSFELPQYKRIIQDVQKVIRHAKLDENTLLPVVQALYYCDATENMRLMELDKELLSKLVVGTELTFRGGMKDKAVLCSDNKTYEVREAETSNSLLVVPNLELPDTIKWKEIPSMTIDHKHVLGVFRTYLEVKPCKPRMKKLSSLLEESEYRGPELESELVESRVNFYTTSQLLNVIQASEAELIIALKRIRAFELNGKWRLLEFNYHFRILSYFLAIIDEQSWTVDRISPSQVMELLEELVPVEILKHLLVIYTKADETSENELKRLNEDEVCRFLGLSLLKSINRLELDEFLQAWKECVPLELSVNLKQLDGLIYITDQGNQTVIHFCSEGDMSEDLSERIQYLFSLKEKWTLEEIKPFVESFTTEKVDENAILTKFARVSKVNGVRVYSSRHGK